MKRALSYIILASLLSIGALAEGTKELRPTNAPNENGFLNPWDWGGEFATYNSPVDKRLNIRVKDHTKEKIYIGLNDQGSTTYIRVKDPNGNIVFGPFLINKTSNSTGFIANYAAATQGPRTVAGGLQGYIPIAIDPTMNGDYYIEINRDQPNTKVVPTTNGGWRILFFDATIADTTVTNTNGGFTARNGRLWAQLWALTTGSAGRNYNANMYVLRDDSIRFKVDYNGIDPFGFGVISNSNGIFNTGNFQIDRKSDNTVYTQGSVIYYPEHKIFLNMPDDEIWPFPKVEPDFAPPINSNDLITGCITTGYCINIESTKPGQVEVLLDLDGQPGYQVGNGDTVVIAKIVQGINCIPWSGLDGKGDTAYSANIQVKYEYEAGLLHIPIYDAENHTNGFIFSLLDSSGGETPLPLFWDDTDIGGVSNLTGCTTPCRSWPTTNYGDNRFINTWSRAFSRVLTLTNVDFEFCPPNAKDDTVQVNEFKLINIDPLVNDEVPLSQWDISSLLIKSGPANGTASIDPVTGTINYRSNLGFSGTDIIYYEICDTFTNARCDSAFIYINVIDVNVPPIPTVINNKPITNPPFTPVCTIPEGDTLEICIGFNDFEGDSSYFQPPALQVPAGGQLIGFGADSCFQFIPSPNGTGADTIIIVTCDNGTPVSCDTLYIPIFLTPVNDPPVITGGGGQPSVNDTIAILPVNEDDTLEVCLTSFDVENDNVSINQLLFPPTNGTTISVLDGDHCFKYIPNPDFNGGDTLTIVMCDDGVPSGCDTVTIVYNVLPDNDPPIALDDFAGVDSGATVKVNVLGNDTDVESTSLSVTIISPPANLGVATVTNDTICYTPNNGVSTGLDTITYIACDGGVPNLCDTAIVVISIPNSDLPPVAVNDTVALPEDGAISINILFNDFDFNFDPLTPTIVTPPQNGNASLATDNKLDYTPVLNYNGPDSMQYAICDTTMPTPLCDTAWVHIDVTPVQDNPLITDPLGNPIQTLMFNINEDDSINICINATDVDGDLLDVTSGTALLGNGILGGFNNNDTCFSYKGNPNVSGIDSLHIIVCDSNTAVAGCDTVLVLMNIAPVNDPPTALPDSIITTEGSSVSFDPSVNDTDAIDMVAVDPTTVSIVTQPGNGMATVGANGIINYVPGNNFSGIDSLQYAICDFGVPLPAECDTAWIYVTVLPVNDPPVAVNDTITTTDNEVKVISVLANDTDPENDPLSVSSPILIQPVRGGAIVNQNNDAILYTPNFDGFCGADSLMYKVCDGSLCDSAWVYITITPADFDGDSLSDYFEVQNGADTDGDLIPNFRDPDSDNDGISDYREAFPVSADLCNPAPLPDFDNDGVPDYLDLDSDNDGIPDYAERDGLILIPLNADDDQDGIDNQFDEDLGGTFIDLLADTDEDGEPDVHDTDSDNDSIPDWVEGNKEFLPDLTTLRNTADHDSDGVINEYDPQFLGSKDLFSTPEDTDGDGTPDFRDLDSDGDTKDDQLEKGAFGRSPGAALRNTDGNLPNSDNIPDFRDTDSDNDGISDGNESGQDCNNNGIPDEIDPEPCPGIAQGFSPNGDNINDFFKIPGLYDENGNELFPNNSFKVFNRWGNLVYTKSPYRSGNEDWQNEEAWRGETNQGSSIGGAGTALTTGTYFYVFDYGDGREPITGYIYLKQ